MIYQMQEQLLCFQIVYSNGIYDFNFDLKYNLNNSTPTHVQKSFLAVYVINSEQYIFQVFHCQGSNNQYIVQ